MSELKQKSEGNRALGTMWQRPRSPGPFQFLSKPLHQRNKLSFFFLFPPEFTSVALTGQDVFIIYCVTWKWLIDHQSVKEEEYPTQKVGEVAPNLMTIAPVALSGKHKSSVRF